MKDIEGFAVHVGLISLSAALFYWITTSYEDVIMLELVAYVALVVALALGMQLFLTLFWTLGSRLRGRRGKRQ